MLKELRYTSRYRGPRVRRVVGVRLPVPNSGSPGVVLRRGTGYRYILEETVRPKLKEGEVSTTRNLRSEFVLCVVTALLGPLTVSEGLESLRGRPKEEYGIPGRLRSRVSNVPLRCQEPVHTEPGTPLPW